MKPEQKNNTKGAEKNPAPEVQRDFLTNEDLVVLNTVFEYAKMHTIENDDNLLELLMTKKNLFKKLKTLLK